MSESEKATLYGMLLNQHTKLHNQINEVKGQSIDLNKNQLDEINKMEAQQKEIMKKINLLLSR